MNDPFGLQNPQEIYVNKERILEIERQEINDSISYLSLSTRLSKVPVYTALQIILRKIQGESNKVDQLSEAEIIKYYRSILLVLKSEMSSPEKNIIIETEMLPNPITGEFLDFLVKESFAERNDLGSWQQFASKSAEFFIPIVKIKKFLLIINRYQNIYPQKSTTSTQARQEFLIKIYKDLSKEDQALLDDKPQGKHGIKDKVRKSISDEEFTLHFADIDHNFANAWKAVRKILKNKNQFAEKG
ncbi:hypothetical protein E0H88_11790 [Acinetobacter sp. ANC 4216]|uniref:hypothetical protein n=1 Tax=Acinetobacter sp. ANC 4216 TaxID=2529840 RepID=UPI00103939A8|nr:hypothetical protein [Acinetobacter sp. ANC 4216]TCB69257.1 hypothetical protein E0H88_11790 [Acinetobacter sp. ANC 4216]